MVRPAPCRLYHPKRTINRTGRRVRLGPTSNPVMVESLLHFGKRPARRVLRCSGNRSGDPIVAGQRPDYYAINYPELQAGIEIAHRPLIEVDDAARRQWPHVIYLDDDLLAYGLNE